MPERSAAAVLKSGQRVSLYVRSVNSDGTARVQVAGADIVAKSEMPRGFSLQAGMLLKGRVFFEDGKVYIRLAQPAADQKASFSRLLASSGIAPSEAASRALQLFCASGMRIEPSLVRQALVAAAAFPKKEARAAEAAALILQKGLPLTGESVKLALAIIEGKTDVLRINPDGEEEPRSKGKRGESGGKSADDGLPSAHGGQGEGSREAGGFWAEFTGQNLQYNIEDNCAKPTWLILPFKRKFGGIDCTGSIRFLVDGAGTKALETRITAVSSSLEEAGGFSADFVLSESGCRFAFTPQPGGRQAKRLCAELSKMLEGARLSLPVEYGLGSSFAELAAVDIEA